MIQPYDNVTYVLGAAAGIGTTMLAQSIAEWLSDCGQKVLLMSCNAISGVCFLTVDENTRCLDDYRNQLQNHLLTQTEVRELLLHTPKLTVLLGMRSILGRGLYQPGDMQALLSLLVNDYDQIIIDCDSIEQGLTVGALQVAARGFYIITQQEKVVNAARQQSTERVLAQIGAADPIVVVNQYVETGIRLLMEEINLTLNTKALQVPYTNYGWQAEHDHKSMLVYGMAEYRTAIELLVKHIAPQVCSESSSEKKGWLSQLRGGKR